MYYIGHTNIVPHIRTIILGYILQRIKAYVKQKSSTPPSMYIKFLTYEIISKHFS